MLSPEDLEITRRLKEAGELLGIPLLDHIIIGLSFYSIESKAEYRFEDEEGDNPLPL